MEQQRHRYEYHVNPYAAGAKVVSMVGEGRRVLEIGSGPGSITRLLKANQCRITALELDEEAIRIVSEFCERVLPCDLNQPSWPDLLADQEKFEVIVAGDVLEHLYDPWGTLRALPTLLAEGGSIIVSLPHVGHNAVIACLLSGDLAYQPWGLLDRTHIRFFALKNVQRMFAEAGLKIIEADFVTKTPEQTEFAQVWQKLPQETRQLLETNPFGIIYQIVVKAVPLGAPGKGIDLLSLPVLPPPPGAFPSNTRGNRLLARLARFMSPRTRERIARLLGL